MEMKVKSEITSELMFTAIVDSTSEVGHLNKNKIEFLLSQSTSGAGLVLEHDVGSVYSGMSLKLKMEEEVKPEVASDILLSPTIDSTSDVIHLNEIKKEFPHSGPHSYVKHNDVGIQSLNLQVKSEVTDLNCGVRSADDDIYIEHKPMVSEELHIKDEVQESRVDHTIKMSTQIKYYNCDLCSSKFKLKKHLNQHMKTHTGVKPYKCIACDYRCMQKNNLHRHSKTHTGEKPYKCSVCDFRFMWKSNLERHNLTHTGEKPYKCSVCEYRFMRKSNLERHNKTHTGEKPFNCVECDYSCIQKSALQQHIKTHTGEKPYNCIVCDYRCISKSDLERHNKTHTGEKPLKCSACGYRCIRKNMLQRHMKTHRGENAAEELA